MNKVVLASNNTGKLNEFQQLFLQHFKDQPIELINQAQLNVVEAEETGLTFIENALLKARNACQQTGLPALADDSGLEVDALQGAPGIYSARFAHPDEGFGSGDAANNQKLLMHLKHTPEAQRTARFHCVLVYMRHAEDPTPQVFQGQWEGRILLTPTGTQGFGYDPVFYVPTHQCSAAELTSHVKNQESHRAQALAHMIHRWRI